MMTDNKKERREKKRGNGRNISVTFGEKFLSLARTFRQLAVDS